MSKLLNKKCSHFWWQKKSQKPFYHKAVQTVTSQLFVKGGYEDWCFHLTAITSATEVRDQTLQYIN